MTRSQTRVETLLARFFFLAAAVTVVLPAAAAETLTFEHNIRPILKVHCFDCHGANEDVEGGLDLRLRRFMVHGGDTGAAIVPGSPEESYLYQRVRDGEMPPGDVKMSPEEVAVLQRWIASGAKTARDEPETLAGGVGITAEEREFWSFQPIQRPALPKASEAGRVRTPIDAFLLDELQRRQLSFSPDADKRALIRRAYLDLLGLPPTYEAVEAFLANDAPDAWERLVDELLESPHYGERWARHWLDVAGYADSEGDAEGDRARAFAYKYRDYVIRSLNGDKPFDQFIQEQLAGDEMVQPPYRDLSPEAVEKLVATGFLRMAADPTVASGEDTAKNQVIADTIKVVSTSLLGLSVGCAQCHDHRYDPIPHTDYYRLRAVFEPALNWKSWRNPNARRISLYTEEDRAKAAAIEAEISKIINERATKEQEFVLAALDEEVKNFPEEVRGPIKIAYKTPSQKRTKEQQALLDAYPSAKITGGVLYQYNSKASDEIKKYTAKMEALRKKKPFEDFLRVLTEVEGQVPQTHRFHRGDHQQPKEVVAPGGLTIAAPEGKRYDIVANDASLPSTGRRLAYARWLTNGRHPLVARVIVNRVWLHHLGQGLVATPGDFGKLGAEPTHPALLDWLADEFMSSGWSLKRLHKLILSSTVYRQSSTRRTEGDAVDPSNQLYWRKSVVRLDAEAVRDRMLAVSGELERSMFGTPAPISVHATGQIVTASARRSLYLQARRTQPVAMLKEFDAPVMQTNCDQRPSSTVASQALLLMNSDFILRRAVAFARRLRAETLSTTTGDPEQLAEQAKRAWRLAYARSASADEERTAREFLATQLPLLKERDAARREREKEAAAKKSDDEKKNEDKKKDKKKGEEPLDPELQALTNLCQALLSSNEFLYVD